MRLIGFTLLCLFVGIAALRGEWSVARTPRHTENLYSEWNTMESLNAFNFSFQRDAQMLLAESLGVFNNPYYLDEILASDWLDEIEEARVNGKYGFNTSEVYISLTLSPIDWGDQNVGVFAARKQLEDIQDKGLLGLPGKTIRFIETADDPYSITRKTIHYLKQWIKNILLYQPVAIFDAHASVDSLALFISSVFRIPILGSDIYFEQAKNKDVYPFTTTTVTPFSDFYRGICTVAKTFGWNNVCMIHAFSTTGFEQHSYLDVFFKEHNISAPYTLFVPVELERVEDLYSYFDIHLVSEEAKSCRIFYVGGSLFRIYSLASWLHKNGASGSDYQFMSDDGLAYLHSGALKKWDTTVAPFNYPNNVTFNVTFDKFVIEEMMSSVLYTGAYMDLNPEFASRRERLDEYISAVFLDESSPYYDENAYLSDYTYITHDSTWLVLNAVVDWIRDGHDLKDRDMLLRYMRASQLRGTSYELQFNPEGTTKSRFENLFELTVRINKTTNVVKSKHTIYGFIEIFNDNTYKFTPVPGVQVQFNSRTGIPPLDAPVTWRHGDPVDLELSIFNPLVGILLSVVCAWVAQMNMHEKVSLLLWCTVCVVLYGFVGGTLSFLLVWLNWCLPDFSTAYKTTDVVCAKTHVKPTVVIVSSLFFSVLMAVHFSAWFQFGLFFRNARTGNKQKDAKTGRILVSTKRAEDVKLSLLTAPTSPRYTTQQSEEDRTPERSITIQEGKENSVLSVQRAAVPLTEDQQNPVTWVVIQWMNTYMPLQNEHSNRPRWVHHLMFLTYGLVLNALCAVFAVTATQYSMAEAVPMARITLAWDVKQISGIILAGTGAYLISLWLQLYAHLSPRAALKLIALCVILVGCIPPCVLFGVMHSVRASYDAPQNVESAMLQDDLRSIVLFVAVFLFLGLQLFLTFENRRGKDELKLLFEEQWFHRNKAEKELEKSRSALHKSEMEQLYGVYFAHRAALVRTSKLLGTCADELFPDAVRKLGAHTFRDVEKAAAHTYGLVSVLGMLAERQSEENGLFLVDVMFYERLLRNAQSTEDEMGRHELVRLADTHFQRMVRLYLTKNESPLQLNFEGKTLETFHRTKISAYPSMSLSDKMGLFHDLRKETILQLVRPNIKDEFNSFVAALFKENQAASLSPPPLSPNQVNAQFPNRR